MSWYHLFSWTGEVKSSEGNTKSPAFSWRWPKDRKGETFCRSNFRYCIKWSPHVWFSWKNKYHPYMVIWEALCIFGYTIALEFLEEYIFSKMFTIWAVPSCNAANPDIYAGLLNSCSFSHQWHKPETHNTWFQAQRKAAAAPDSSRCDFFWAVNVHSLFLSRNSCAEQSSQSCHLWLYSGTSLHRIQCHNRHMKLENQEWHEEVHVVCK